MCCYYVFIMLFLCLEKIGKFGHDFSNLIPTFMNRTKTVKLKKHCHCYELCELKVNSTENEK